MVAATIHKHPDMDPIIYLDRKGYIIQLEDLILFNLVLQLILQSVHVNANGR